jgi:hypothetical protein
MGMLIISSIDGDRWRQVDPAWELTPVDADPWSTTGTPRPGSARPRSAAPSSRRGTSVSAVSAEEPDDGADRFVYFEIADAATGHVYQCARTTDAVTNKLYYEDSTDSWKVLPAVWEAAQPSTARLLEEMDAVLPQWRNVTEQVRKCSRERPVSLQHGDTTTKLTCLCPLLRGFRFSRCGFSSTM